MAHDQTPNAAQAALWNDASGQTWRDMQTVLDDMLAPFVEPLLPLEARHVLDIGCGAGATTLAIARHVGPHGRCLGVDISEPLVAAARARARVDQQSNVEFAVGDAQIHEFEAAAFDAIVSRFGVMFFDDPVAAFSNIRRAARPGASLTFVAWRSPQDNPFMTAATRAAAPLLPSFKVACATAPGQFAFADGERLLTILRDSGFRDVDLSALDLPGSVSESDLWAYAAKLGPVGLALREIDEAQRAPIVAAVRAAYQPYLRDGAARFDMAAWLVRARA